MLPEESDLLCAHPMFGPESGKNGWKDLACMYERVRIRNEALCSSFLQIFEREASNHFNLLFQIFVREYITSISFYRKKA